MNLNYSFIDAHGEINGLALIELLIVSDIINGFTKASLNLRVRCTKIRDMLIRLPNVIGSSKIKSLSDLRFEPWYYEKLNRPQYKNLSSIRLTEFDRLVFDESIENEMIVIEELFHYLRELDISKLSGTDKELHNILKEYLISVNYSKLVNKLYSQTRSDKIWIF